MDISNPVFIAACVFTREHPQLSKVVQEYIHTRFNMPIMRCCVKNYMVKEFENEMQPKISEQWNNLPHYIDVNESNTVIYICHNCLAIFQEQLPKIPIMSFWELVLNDDSFPYPDYKGEKITLQDCWRSYDNTVEQDTVRKLLKKMNVEIVELEENREKTDFCGISLFSPAPERNLKLAPKRFVENAEGKFIEHSEEEQKKIMEDYCKNITTEKVVSYCHYCAKGLKVGGKDSFHLAHLLFGLA